MGDEPEFDAYTAHHDGCPLCIAAGQGRGSRCAAGNDLWRTYADRWCWPASNAMNTQEIEVFQEREKRLGELLADRLVLRDRSQDARVSCGECRQGKSSVCDDRLPKPWNVLNHCHAFKAGPFEGDLPVVRKFGRPQAKPAAAKPAQEFVRAEDF